jgi:hypothetical protein
MESLDCERRESRARRGEPGWRGSASLSERSEQSDTRVLSSASDDELGGYERAMREQSQ